MVDQSPHSSITDLQIQELVLERLRMQARKAVGPAVLQSMELSVIADWIQEELLVTLAAEVLAEKLESQLIRRGHRVVTHFHQPDGRFQRWKMRHWDSWWCRWMCLGRPVRFLYEQKQTMVHLVVEVKDYATFPHAAYVPPPPELGPPVFKRLISSHTEEEEIDG